MLFSFRVWACVRACAHFSLIFSLVVCFSSSSHVVCLRTSWENPNTSRKNGKVVERERERERETEEARRQKSGRWRFVTQTSYSLDFMQWNAFNASWFMCLREPRSNFRMLDTFFRRFFLLLLFCLSPSPFHFVRSPFSSLFVFVCYSFDRIFVWFLAVELMMAHTHTHTPPQPHFRCHKFSISIKCLIHKNKQKHDACACVSNLCCCPTIFSLRMCVFDICFCVYILHQNG